MAMSNSIRHFKPRANTSLQGMLRDKSTYKANDVVDYVKGLLVLDGPALTDIASHMRFVEDDQPVQWWIRELKDNYGNAVRTKA